MCAEKLGCPIGDANKQAHKKFGEVFDGIYKEYLHNPSEEIAHRTHKELSDWIIGHVLKIDTQIGVCYKKSRARAEKA